MECITINGIIWAPVNCGYDATNYPYGKLYQWGRMNGCGYNDGSTYKETIIQIAALGPVKASSEDAAKFYTNSYNWLTTRDVARWNSGTVASAVKTQYDPCPSGWRVPMYDELNALTGNSGSTSIGSAGWDSTKEGYWFNGTKTPKSGEGLFLPAAGCRSYDRGGAFDRGSYGSYWSSLSVSLNSAWILEFTSGTAGMDGGCRASGFSVRCVQE